MRAFPIATAASACLLVSALAVPVALAKGHHHPVFPSKHKVHQAQQAVEDEKDLITSIRAKLEAANQSEQDAQDQAEVASEAYNGARWEAQQAEDALTAARKRAKIAADDLDTQRQAYAVAVVGNYQYAPQLTTLVAIAQSAGLTDLQQKTAAIGESQRALNAQYGRVQAASTLSTVAAQQAADAAKAAEKAEDAAKEKRDAAATAVAAAVAETQRIEDRKTELIHELAQLEHISVSLAKKRQQGLEELARERAERKREREEKKREEEAAAQAGNNPNAPPSPAGVAAAIAFAHAQIGDPYVWAADGMSDWDCSGLTMMAWRQGGIELPHWSVEQYALSTPISRSQLQPGDLVFWSLYGTPSSIHHVALYVGDGMIIQAPHTGAYVEEVSLSSLYDQPDLFGRP